MGDMPAAQVLTEKEVKSAEQGGWLNWVVHISFKRQTIQFHE